MDATATRQVSNSDGTIYLFDLYKNNGEFRFEPCLVFEKAKFDGCWDNETYVFKFFRQLKKNKKKEVKELKDFCKENNFDYEKTFTDLINIYKTAKQLNFFKL